MFKKLIACLTVLVMLFSVVSCADREEAPDGYKSATVSAGEPFILYVPESWNVNTASGISGAYYTTNLKDISVSARYQTPDNKDMTLETYVSHSMDILAAEFAGAYFTVTAASESIPLDGRTAIKTEYEIDKNGARLLCVHIAVKHENGDFITLCFYCPKDQYEQRKADFDGIKSNFKLREKAVSADSPVVDKKTPAGMEIASNKDIEYRLYVPEIWICDSESGANDAYYPESERSNILVTSYSPDTSMSIADYFSTCETSYKTQFGESYIREGEPVKRTVADREASVYVYTVTVEGVPIKIMQTILVHDSTFYTITYTAHADRYEEHMADVDAILNNFTFR